MRGAEAIVSKGILIGRACAVKSRIAKKYRVRELDEKLRIERTRSEARLLHKAKLAGVDCPTVLEAGEFSITMSFVEGQRPKMSERQCIDAGKILAKLHASDIIHGDYTPANLIENKEQRANEKLFVIDFGLGFISNDVEDKAVDVFTMLRALGENRGTEAKDAFISGYKSYEKSHAVLERVKVVESRVRYAV